MKPDTVEVGQIWRDRDERSKGSGEFVIERVTADHALVYRRDSELRRYIKTRRLLGRDYIYVGMSR